MGCLLSSTYEASMENVCVCARTYTHAGTHTDSLSPLSYNGFQNQEKKFITGHVSLQ